MLNWFDKVLAAHVQMPESSPWGGGVLTNTFTMKVAAMAAIMNSCSFFVQRRCKSFVRFLASRRRGLLDYSRQAVSQHLTIFAFSLI